jgi:quinol monooxygenase YgiN
MIRKLFFLLSALVLVAFPVHAQTPAPQHGLKAGYITLVVTAEVLPGQMDNFRQLVPRLVAAVAAEEPGTLVYEWSFYPDQKTYNLIEVYQNSDAVAAHAKHMAADFLKELGQVRKITNAIVFGLAGCAGQGSVGLS